MMFASARKTLAPPWVVGVQPGLAAAVRLGPPAAGAKPVLLGVRLVDSSRPTEARLEAIASAIALNREPVQVLLEPGSYQFLQTELPQVPAEEMKTALRWKVKDMLGQPLDETGLDALLPGGGAIAGRGSAYVIAAPKSLLRSMMMMFRPWAARVVRIGVAEAAQRGVADRLEEEGRATALLSITPSSCLLTASCAGEIFFVRNFELSCLSLNTSESVRREQFDRLVLELQRSLDVIERQFAQYTVSTLWISPFEHAEDLLGLLVDSLYLPVKIINLATLVDTRQCPLPVGADAQAALFHPLGMALGEFDLAHSQVDLVDESLLPPKPFFQFRRMMVALAVVSIALLLIALIINASVSEYLAVADQMRVRREETENRLRDLAANHKPRTADPELTETLKREREETERLNRLSITLADAPQEGSTAASRLDALAAATLEGVWLERVELHEMQLSVQGYARSPALLPTYLERLQAQPAFAGQRFASFELGRKRVGSSEKSPDALLFSLLSAEENKP